MTFSRGRRSSSTVWSASAVSVPGESLRPEPADVLRLGRRLVRMAVASCARGRGPDPGSSARRTSRTRGAVATRGERGWAPYEHVNLQGALERWTQAPGRSTTLVGLTDFQHSMFTLADLAQPASLCMVLGSVRWPWSDWLRSRRPTRACVRCGLYLVERGRGSLGAAVTRKRTRVAGRSSPRSRCCAPIRTGPRRCLSEIRQLALEHSVFRGQIFRLAQRCSGLAMRPLTFHERPAMTREDLVLPEGVLEAVEAQVVGSLAIAVGWRPAASTSSAECCCTARRVPARPTRCVT